MFKKILAVGAHCDDIELGCVGTLFKFQAQGADFDIVIARNDNVPRPSTWRSRDQMTAEYQASENVIGKKFNFLENKLDPTGRPLLECNSTTIEQLDNFIKNKDYDLVITHSPGDHHQDHVNTFHIVNSALRRFKGEFWTWEESPYSNRNKSFNPNIFVDITSYIDKKIASVSCYNSYFNDLAIEHCRGLASFRGQMSGTKYAESFELRYRIIK